MIFILRKGKIFLFEEMLGFIICEWQDKDIDFKFKDFHFNRKVQEDSSNCVTPLSLGN